MKSILHSFHRNSKSTRLVSVNTFSLDDKPLRTTPSQTAPTHLERARRRIEDLWLQEILFWSVSAALTVSLMVILKVHQNQPVPEWPYHITLNSVISLLTALARAAMLEPVIEAISQLKWFWFLQRRPLSHFTTFDEASRGPWGSLKLLRLAHQAPIPAIDALVVIASIAVDPFAQQIVNYPMRRALLGPAENITIVQEYNDYIHYQEHAGPTLPIKGALFNSIYGYPSIAAPSCPSGDCTWDDPYTTLAVCDACEDITSQAKVTEFDGPYSMHHNAGYQDPGWKACNVSLPNNATLSVRDQADLFFNMTNLHSALSGTPWTETIPRAEMVNVTMIKGSPLAKDCNITVKRCSLNFCVRSFTSKFTNGKFEETPVSTFMNRSLEWYLEERPEGGFNYGILITPPRSVLRPGQPDAFKIWQATGNAFQQYMAFLFNGTGRVDWASAPTPYFVSQTESGQMYMGKNDGLQLLSPAVDLAQSAYFAEDIESFFRGIALSLTSALRVNATMKTPPESIDVTRTRSINGTMWSQVAYVNVRWPWIWLMVILNIITLGLLAATILMGLNKELPPWKSSVLPTLRCGLDPTWAQELDDCTRLYEMDRFSRDTELVLRSTAVQTWFCKA